MGPLPHPHLLLPNARNQFFPTAHCQLSKDIFFLPHRLSHSCVSSHSPSVYFLIPVGDKPSRPLTGVLKAEVVLRLQQGSLITSGTW